jgi:hypothetical protein
MYNILFIGRASRVCHTLLSSQTPVPIQGVDQAGTPDHTCVLTHTANSSYLLNSLTLSANASQRGLTEYVMSPKAVLIMSQN